MRRAAGVCRANAGSLREAPRSPSAVPEYALGPKAVPVSASTPSPAELDDVRVERVLAYAEPFDSPGNASFFSLFMALDQSKMMAGVSL